MKKTFKIQWKDKDGDGEHRAFVTFKDGKTITAKEIAEEWASCIDRTYWLTISEVSKDEETQPEII